MSMPKFAGSASPIYDDHFTTCYLVKEIDVELTGIPYVKKGRLSSFVCVLARRHDDSVERRYRRNVM
jgi:hypothetical protein